VVFVSSDKSKDEFASYFGEQPWAALPYQARDIKTALSKKYKVQGIPTLVILGPDGEVITKEGRNAVSADPQGAKYPWHPPSAAEKAQQVLASLGPELVAKAGGKPIGLYFSAHWCPPCRGFTPQLAEWYKAGLREKMEIIFVSSDRDQKSFDEYFKEMPWLALQYESRDAKQALSEIFGVSGIPSFVVLHPDGTTITTDGRSQVASDPTGAQFPNGWYPQPPNPFIDVNDDPSDLNEERCVIAMGDSKAAHDAVEAVANEYYTAAGKDVENMPMRFFKATEGRITAQLRTLTQVDGDKLIILDIPDDGGFYVCDSGVATPDDVKAFINGVESKGIERKQLKK
jgi:nucleoredoxin